MKRARLRSYSTQLSGVDKRITAARGIIARNASTHAGYYKLAAAYLQRARLTGSLDDYAEAEAAIEATFEKTSAPAYMARARLNYALHRLDRIDDDFEQAKRLPGKTMERAAHELVFASNLALARGDAERAKTFLDEAATLAGTHHVLTARALLEWKTGNLEKADALLAQAVEVCESKDAEPIAWMHLHRGLLDLDRGRLDDALAHYREAESLIEGYWLIDEHIAEVLTLQGKTERAKNMYLDIIERTDNPEFMDAMARILLDEGNDVQARAYISRAEARYEAQMQQYPESAYGHALEHYLDFGEEPQRTVELAEKNHALRPNAEAKALLARAYSKAGREEDAETVVKR